MDRNMSERTQISMVGTTGTSATLNSDIIDMASNGGFNSIMFIGHGAASQADGQLIAQVGTASGSLSDATGNVLAGKATLYLDMPQIAPGYRFVRGAFQAGSATIAYKTLTAIAYNARSKPTTQPASTTGAAFYSPGTGTASG